MHSVPPIGYATAAGPATGAGPNRPPTGLLLVLGVLSGIAGLAVDVSGQLPRAPANVQMLRDMPQVFAGAIVYVSTSGSDSYPGTPTSPVRTIQRGVTLANQANTNGNNALVSIAAGVYREVVAISSLNTTKTLTLEGQGAGTVLTGADDWSTGWTAQSDGTYVHTWPYKWGAQPLPTGWEGYWNWDGKGYLRDRVLRYEMVYINDMGLLGRLNRSELSTPGTFYVDEPNSKIYMRPYIGTNLSTAIIEVAVRYKMLTVYGRNNVTVKNMTIEKGRGSVQSPVGSNMFEVTSARNVVVDGVTVRRGAGGGFSGFYVTNLTIRNSKFIDNGIKSLETSSSSNVLLEDSEISRNNWRGWDAEHKGFASNNKFLLMRGLTVRRVKFTDNKAHGLWLDSDNKNVLIDTIFSANNGLTGFFSEFNQGPVTIQNSTFCQNGTTGIGTSHGSLNLTVTNTQSFNNLLAQLGYGGQPQPQTIREWDTGQAITLDTRNHVFTGNTFVGYGTPQWFQTPPEGWLRWGPDQGQLAGWLATYRGDNNRYYHTSDPVAFMQGRKDGTNAFVRMDFATWRASYANDPSNVNKNNEANSTWGDPGPLSCVAPF